MSRYQRIESKAPAQFTPGHKFALGGQNNVVSRKSSTQPVSAFALTRNSTFVVVVRRRTIKTFEFTVLLAQSYLFMYCWLNYLITANL